MGQLLPGIVVILFCLNWCAAEPGSRPASRPVDRYELDYDSPLDPDLQARLEAIDASLRSRLGMSGEHAAVGVLDLKTLRLALIHPDRIEYAASVPKVGILLAYFQSHPEASGCDWKYASRIPTLGTLAAYSMRSG